MSSSLKLKKVGGRFRVDCKLLNKKYIPLYLNLTPYFVVFVRARVHWQKENVSALENTATIALYRFTLRGIVLLKLCK